MQLSKQIDSKLKYKFCELRAHILGWCLNDVWIRIDDQKKIVPTEEEMRLNTIWELIEPQVRDAVKELNRKGYCTTDSGFSGTVGMHQKQFIEGLFKLDIDTVNKLQELGVYVKNDGWRSIIWFYAENPDFEEIKRTWNEIVILLPDLGQQAKSQKEIEAPVLKRIWAEMERKEKSKKD